MPPNLIVARYLDGRVVKGTSLNVDPARPTCHVRTDDGPIEVVLSELKALFFVRTLAGDARHEEGRDRTPGDARMVGGSPITVRFADGEEVVGATNRYPPNRPFFYVVPVDPRSNNVRILVNRAAAVSISDAAAGARPAARGRR